MACSNASTLDVCPTPAATSLESFTSTMVFDLTVLHDDVGNQYKSLNLVFCWLDHCNTLKIRPVSRHC
jgi:hypothetical protein